MGGDYGGGKGATTGAEKGRLRGRKAVNEGKRIRLNALINGCKKNTAPRVWQDYYYIYRRARVSII